MKTPQVLAPDTGTYKLQRALLIYHSPRGGHYVSAHEVDINNGQLLAGHAAKTSDLRELANSIITRTAVEGWISPSMLYLSADMIIWHRPASIETLFFNTKDRGPLSGVRSIRAPQPALVFAAFRNGWYVWALAGADRPGPDTPLMNAPYWNVWKSGSICTGNVQLPKRLGPETTAKFEDAFFGSNFTHPNHTAITKTDTAALWADLHDGAETFPADELIPTGKTLGQAIAKLIKGDPL